MSDNDFPCCAPAGNLRPDSGVIERVKAVLYKKGAYCGVCDFDPEPCSECDQCLTGYAQALAAAGLLTSSDADVAERIGAILREHQPTSGMQVASGVTCRCGYWTGEERPGVTRPVGYSGLMWHQAQMIATPPVTATSEEVDHYPMSAISVRGESAFCEWCGGEFESVDLYREHERVMVLARQAREATTREEADRG